ncbi:MAG: hypothetical protein ACYTEL_04485 [Planctomycetota bacterium]|jgi:uncharacterized protein (DUF2345 family)
MVKKATTSLVAFVLISIVVLSALVTASDVAVKPKELYSDDDLTIKADGEVTVQSTTDWLTFVGPEDFMFKPSGDDNDYIKIRTLSNVPEIGTYGDCDLKITAQGGDIDFSDENLATTGAGTFGELKLSSYDYLGWWSGGARKSYIYGSDSGMDLELYAPSSVYLEAASSVNLDADSSVYLKSSGDTDDYIRFLTTSNVPEITTVGTCDLKLTSSSGSISFNDDNLTTTGSGTFGELKLDAYDYLGWWYSGARKSYIRTTSSSSDLDVFAYDDMNITADDEIEIKTNYDWITVTSDDYIRLRSSGDTDDYIRLRTSSNVPEIGTSGSCDLKLTSSSGQVTVSGDLDVTDTLTVDTLVLPVKTTTGDPAGPVTGQIYVNTYDNKIRVYADGAWRDLATW